MDNYNKILYPNGITLDLLSSKDVEQYAKNEAKSKYKRREKSKLISFIIDNGDFEDEAFIKKIKKCLPIGLNKYLSIEDSEYELLRKEFNLQDEK